MSTKNNGSFSDFILGKGFYFILALCIAGAGAAGYLAINSQNEILTPEPANPPQIVATPNEPVAPPVEVNIQNSNIPILEEDRAEEAVVNPAENIPVEEQPVDAMVSPITFIMPAEGIITEEYSGDELVKNETLGDWRTHNGIDISAEEGTKVVAVADGVIIDVKNDPLWGRMVVIKHDNGVNSIYCGLSDEVNVSKNKEIKQGNTVGTIGYIPCESKLPSHLHFEVTVNGERVDPQDIMD